MFRHAFLAATSAVADGAQAADFPDFAAADPAAGLLAADALLDAFDGVRS
ncbi:hypothetical protein P8605_23465 [Streptomyces sp. T-3]|nr:hypothetical protein [Streptomyces sp. T-3]